MKKITTFADLKTIIERIFNRMIHKQLIPSKYYLILLSFFCFSLTLHAQTIVNSPFSYIGMGELYPSESPINSMMSGVGISNSNGIYSNQMNPALLARNRYTVLEAGVNVDVKNMQDFRQRQQIAGGNYQSFSLTLPIKPRWTMSIGIRPYSTVNYQTKSFRRLNVLGVDSVIYSYKGEGGVGKLIISNGVRIGKELYLGLETGYLFGSVNRNVATQNMSDGQYYKIQLENQSQYGDFTFKGGLAYRHKLKEEHFLNIGATMDLTSRLSAKSLRRFATFDVSGITLINADTLQKAVPFVQNLPVSTSFGISVERIARWMVGIDYSRTDWSKVDNNLGRAASLPISSKIAFGAEYTPDFESLGSYFKRTTYRFGSSYTTTPYDYAGNGKYAIDRNISLGASFPLRSFLNYLNVSYQVGRRGLLSDNGLEEQYHRIIIGMTLNDVWFVKQRIN